MTLLESATRDAASPDEGVRLAALARKAVYLARRGDREEANRAAAELRTKVSSAHYTAAIARANLVEGVSAFCDLDFAGAADKLRRAAAMSNSIGDQHLRRWCESWQTHIQFCLARFDAALEIALRLVQEASPSEHSCHSRLGSTVASVIHYFGRYDLARPWYEYARWHATSEGDDLTIDVVLHNTAAYDLNNLRLAEIDSERDPVELQRVALELSSSINYDRMKAPASFRWMLPLLDFHLSLLRSEFSTAANQINEWLQNFSEAAPKRLVCIAHSDLALCAASCGETRDAIEGMRRATNALPTDATPDDRAILFFRCSQIARLTQTDATAAEFESRARAHLADFRLQQAHYVPAFAALVRPNIGRGQH